MERAYFSVVTNKEILRVEKSAMVFAEQDAISGRCFDSVRGSWDERSLLKQLPLDG
jgi:hypothetical protein